MEVTTIIMTQKGIINIVRNLVNIEKAEQVFSELILANDSFATQEDVNVALDNGVYENTNGLDITIMESLIEMD